VFDYSWYLNSVFMKEMHSTGKANREEIQLMERRGYGAEYIERYKMMTRYVLVDMANF
jgi:hypothetical protein